MRARPKGKSVERKLVDYKIHVNKLKPQIFGHVFPSTGGTVRREISDWQNAILRRNLSLEWHHENVIYLSPVEKNNKKKTNVEEEGKSDGKRIKPGNDLTQHKAM